MYSFLQRRKGPIVEGLEAREITFGKNQPQYDPIKGLRSGGPDARVLSRWTLTEEQRKAIAEGADIFLEVLTFRYEDGCPRPPQPVRLGVSDGKLDPFWVSVFLLEEADVTSQGTA